MNIPTSPLKPPLPPPPQPAVAHHSGLSDSSPLLSIITILAFVIFVVLIYAAFFAIRCPTTISNSGRPAGNSTLTRIGTSTDALDQLVSSVVYKEAADAGKDGGGECPVCLTAFVDGEVIREVKVCKHLFHDSCIEAWLRAHSNCPVCRVFVGTKWSKRPVVDGSGGDEDFRQGLPDSASLV
ncbi:hypothetical protein RHSIM_Rhsim05G0191000 [Rhododendron simsii]|uniref:RING-type E3 ubiquitin transferase n=1 Tax=Rhododendron simsii TaxID=118357 RepID=A0A834GWZ8_RHOSS|nr:hypothetical protein RHSIM_Rhsim05G0191000 [Rhododendron simsii]